MGGVEKGPEVPQSLGWLLACRCLAPPLLQVRALKKSGQDKEEAAVKAAGKQVQPLHFFPCPPRRALPFTPCTPTQTHPPVTTHLHTCFFSGQAAAAAAGAGGPVGGRKIDPGGQAAAGAAPALQPAGQTRLERKHALLIAQPSPRLSLEDALPYIARPRPPAPPQAEPGRFGFSVSSTTRSPR